MQVKVADLVVTQSILQKSGYTDSVLSLEKLVSWDSLQGIPSISRGPKVDKIIYKMSWLATLKIMLEVILVGVIGPNAPADYVDLDLLEKMGNKRKSSDDFEAVPKKNKITKTIPKSKIIKSRTSKKHPREELPSWMEPSPSENNKGTPSTPGTPQPSTSTGHHPTLPTLHELSSSPATTPEPFGSPFNPKKIVVNPKVSDTKQNKTTPKQKSRECPIVPFLNDIIELENSQKYTSLYKGKIVQVIGFNQLSRQGMINIRISDSRFWVDCNVDSDLRIYFAGDMIRVNDLLIIDGSTGTIGGKDFCIVNLRRPGSVQIPGLGRVGSPIPLFSDCVNINRGYERLNIKPLSMDTLNNIDALDTEDPNDNVFNDSDDEELLAATQEPVLNPIGEKETLNLQQLLELTNNPEKLTVADTPLGKYHVSEPKLTQSSISKFVFANATQMYQSRKYDEDEIELKNNKLMCTVESEFSIKEYKVELEWPELMPRTDRGFFKTFPARCSCGAFADHGPKYCKHIIYVIMKHLNYS